MAPEIRWALLASLALAAACTGGEAEETPVVAVTKKPAPATVADAAPPPTAAKRDSAAVPAGSAVPAVPVKTAEPAETAEESSTPETALRENFSYAGGARDPFLTLLSDPNTGPQLQDMLLVGVYQDLRNSANSVAVVKEKKSEKRYKVRVGDRIGLFKVAAIRPRDLIFTVEDFGFERQETLSLKKQEETQP